MPKDSLKLKFVVIPKKPKATKCSDYKTISLVYHGIKLLLKSTVPYFESNLLPEKGGG